MAKLVSYSNSYKAKLEQLYFDIDLQRLLLGEYDKDNLSFDSWLSRRIDGAYFKVCVDNNDQFLGYVQLAGHHMNNQTAFLGICLLREARGKGRGKQLLNSMIIDVKSELSIRKLHLKVRSDNLQAIKLYESMKFQKVGTLLKEYYDSSNYWDVILYERIL